MAGLLTDGKRALSVRVDDVSGVAGFIHPGDHVDVLMEMAKPGSADHFSRIILQNIVVLSAGQTWEQSGDEKPVVVNTVTLVLNTEQAEIMNLASTQGKIRLALRNRNDLAEMATPGVDTSNLLGTNVLKKEPLKVAGSRPKGCGSDQRASAFPGQPLVIRTPHYAKSVANRPKDDGHG